MENPKTVDQKLAPVRALVAARPSLLAGQGAVVATWRLAAGRRLGPYFVVRYRDDGRQRAVYLGRCAVVAEAARELLRRLQQPRRQGLALAKIRAALKASLRRHLPAWRESLAPLGITLKGREIRGWRSLGSASAPRPAIAVHRRP